MSKHLLQRFISPEFLSRISPMLLRKLLSPYRDFFRKHRVDIDAEPLSTKNLATTLFVQCLSIPEPLLESLTVIESLCTDRLIDRILTFAGEHGIAHEGGRKNAADIAVQMWLFDRDLVEQVLGKDLLRAGKTLYFYRSSQTPPPVEFNDATIRCMEEDYNQWLMENGRGRTGRLFVYNDQSIVTILARHGEPFRRLPIIRDGKSSVTVLQPEAYDQLIFDPQTGELGVKARTEKIRQGHLQWLSRHLLAQGDRFCKYDRFMLDNLIHPYVVPVGCADILGIDQVHLDRIEVAIPTGQLRPVRIALDCDELPYHYGQFLQDIPDDAEVHRVKFKIRLMGDRYLRRLVISSPNRIEFGTGLGIEEVHQWLIRRHLQQPTDREKRHEQVLACV